MSHLPPDDYNAGELDRLTVRCHELLLNNHKAVVAMASGGCARYAFSMDVDYCLDRLGYPLVHYSSDNAHHHLIVTNSTMDFRIVLDAAPDGMELSILILTGMLTLVDPGDHDNIDRHSRYFDENIENFSRGNERLYRLIADQARLELFSGRQYALPLQEIIRRSTWAPGEERTLIAFGNSEICHTTDDTNMLRIVGIDGQGVDISDASNMIRRLSFQGHVDNLTDAKRALIEIVKSELVVNP